ncbi:pyridoxamine 5'-phosphate oxidase family protein [Pontibacillus salicampi]|uniref:Pyridoxamine 5'-phosphate oxidase family protein n=1 Tax=Pontibacillus salicampi TaxID=1449801 RepID=A0ABV6LMV7_9BACI
MFKDTVATVEELEALVGKPGKIASHKVISTLDQHCFDFIRHSPFITISTSDAQGRCDVSPRGDQPGFVHIVDEHHILIPERPGNKRVDSMRNLLENPHIGILFMIPGMEESLRINGRAFIVKDSSMLQKTEANGHVPTLGIGVEVEEAFIHCAKAFKRSKLWHPASWLKREEQLKPAKMMAAHAKSTRMSEQDVAASLHESYTKRLY